MATPVIPAKMKQVQVIKLINNFREATRIVEVPVPKPRVRQVLVKTRYLMINASEILFTSGLFTPYKQPPFGAGIEGIGEIVATGPCAVSKVGQAVAFQSLHCFGEYAVVSENDLKVIPSSSDPAYGAFFVSGTTACGAFDKKWQLKKGEVVLVTAAAGATGHIAVQLAKLAGCHVIGTCSSEEKVAFLKSIGCDRPINYKKESVDLVLKKEYPDGFNVAYECIGNEMLDICMQNVAHMGRIISIGRVDVYQMKNHLKNDNSTLPIVLTLMLKSADLATLYMPDFRSDLPIYFDKCDELYRSGKLKIKIDRGEQTEKGPFKGLEQIADAVDYIFSRQSTGKVCVEM